MTAREREEEIKRRKKKRTRHVLRKAKRVKRVHGREINGTR